MFRVPENTNDEVAGFPSFAVDISGAYTSGACGTGFACDAFGSAASSGEDLTQTDTIDRIVGCLQELKKEKTKSVNLIIEAPLSYAVASNGSSDARLREIEKPASYPQLQLSNNRVRPWNCNAGASTAVMALIFLSDLQARAPRDITINLFEGFWSWLPKPNNNNHFEVAMGLLDGLRVGGNRVIRLPNAAVSYRTALQLLGISTRNASLPPPVVFGHEGLANAYCLQA